MSWLSIYDIKYREIPDKHVWGSFYISLALFAITIAVQLSNQPSSITAIVVYTSLSIFSGTGLFSIMYLMGLVGKADVFVITELALLLPTPDVYSIVVYEMGNILRLPPVLLIVLYSAFISILIGASRSFLVSIIYRKAIPRDLPLVKKLVLVLTGRPMSIKSYLSSKHYYPLTIFEVKEGKLTRKYRLTFSVEGEEYWEHQAKVQKLLEEGILSPNDYIWVTYGIPYIVPLLVGLIVFLVVGDAPLALFLRK